MSEYPDIALHRCVYIKSYFGAYFVNRWQFITCMKFSIDTTQKQKIKTTK